METRVFCVELKMGPSGHMDSTGIFPDSNTREFGPRRTTQRQPPRPTHKCNAPRLPFHVHLTHDLTRAASALPLHTAALAFVSFGIVLVQVQVPRVTTGGLFAMHSVPRLKGGLGAANHNAEQDIKPCFLRLKGHSPLFVPEAGFVRYLLVAPALVLEV